VQLRLFPRIAKLAVTYAQGRPSVRAKLAQGSTRLDVEDLDDGILSALQAPKDEEAPNTESPKVASRNGKECETVQ